MGLDQNSDSTGDNGIVEIQVKDVVWSQKLTVYSTPMDSFFVKEKAGITKNGKKGKKKKPVGKKGKAVQGRDEYMQESYFLQQKQYLKSKEIWVCYMDGVLKRFRYIREDFEYF